MKMLPTVVGALLGGLVLLGASTAIAKPRSVLILPFAPVDLVVRFDAVGFRFHIFSRIRGTSISSSLVPPWLPMCKWRASPGVQSFTV